MTLYMFYSELYQADVYWYGSLTVIVWKTGDLIITRDNQFDDAENAEFFDSLYVDSF